MKGKVPDDIRDYWKNRNAWGLYRTEIPFLMRDRFPTEEEQRRIYEARMMRGNGAFQVYFRHYLTADGVVSVAGLTRRLWAKFHDVTGLRP